MPLPPTKDPAFPPTEEQSLTPPGTSFEGWRARARAWPLKRLVALWNALPGVVPVQKFTNREIAVERIWRSVQGGEGRPNQPREQRNPFREGSKAGQVYALLGRPEGATGREIEQLTGWQRHSVRGFLSASVRKQGYKLRSFLRAGERVYRLKS
ncbi:MAG: DUF3489 domain-containing protein [Bryobacteraceae bacterium]